MTHRLTSSFVLGNLCGEGGLHHHRFADEGEAVHGRYAVADGFHQFYLEQQRVARHHLLAELHIVDAQEVRAPALRRPVPSPRFAARRA